MSADRERTALYAAEAAAFEGTDLEVVVGFGRIAEVISRVVAEAWWPGPDVRVLRARSDATSSSARDCVDGVATIRLAREQCTLATAAHELAHVLAGVRAGHGGRFRAALVDVIAVATNIDPSDRRGHLHVDQLTCAFDSAGLEVGARRWPPPPASTPGAIAL